MIMSRELAVGANIASSGAMLLGSLRRFLTLNRGDDIFNIFSGNQEQRKSIGKYRFPARRPRALSGELRRVSSSLSILDHRQFPPVKSRNVRVGPGKCISFYRVLHLVLSCSQGSSLHFLGRRVRTKW